jgi:hypothetical protein
LLYIVALPGTSFIGGFGLTSSDVFLRLLRKELVEGKTRLGTASRGRRRVTKYMIER